jgi:sulfonate transport system permease protein
VVPILLLVFWQQLSDHGYLKPTVMPSPVTLWLTCLEMLKSGELFHHLGVSLLRVAQGFAWGAGMGLAMGLAIGLSPLAERGLFLVTGLLRPIPTIAWVPALILWAGIDESSKVIVIAIGGFWPVLLNTLHGVQSTDRKYLEVARVLQKDRFTVLTKVVFPSALPSIFTGLRIGMGIAWASVVGAELIAASSGIGYLILYAREVSQPDVMLVGVAAIGLTGLLIDFLILKLENRLVKWNRTKP